MKAFLLFEQSGTFKHAFNDLGIAASDYDIRNDYNETDVVIDLFKEIENAYYYKRSIFDSITEDDIVFAFFPCTRFEGQIEMHFRGEAYQYKNYPIENKLLVSMHLHDELHIYYDLISKLSLICINRNLKLIIENPYSREHYLKRYWPIKPSIVDMDRRKDGDIYQKPTQYYFINCEPKQNLVFEPLEYVETKKIHDVGWTKSTEDRARERSEIHPQYAKRFIKKYIL